MIDINDLKKERIRMQKNNPASAKMLMVLLDNAQKIAKEQKREVTEKDFISACQKEIKEMNKVLEIYKDKNVPEKISELTNSINFCSRFVPMALSESETRGLIKITLDLFTPEFKQDKKNRGKIIAKLKEFENIDMALANKILSEYL